MAEIPVTAVIPAWRREATIGRCLASILNSSVRPAEVIVVDDASGDGTVERARECGDLSVRVLEQPKNAGAQAARNRGIAEASNPWIAFLDSDDEWLPGKLERQWSQLQGMGYPDDAVLHGNCVRLQGGVETYWDLPVTEGGDALRRLLMRPAPMFQGMLASRKLLREIGMLDESVPSFQEWDTSIRLSAKGRFFHDREPLFRYHLHTGETISGNPARELKGYSFVVSKHEADIVSIAGKQAWNSHMVRLAELALAADLPIFATQVAPKAFGVTRLLLGVTSRMGVTHPGSRSFLKRILARYRANLGSRNG